MEVLDRLQQMMDEFIKERKKYEKGDAAIESESSAEPTHQSTLLKKPMKRRYVRKNPEVLRAAREANVLMNRFSRAARNKERYEKEKSAAGQWFSEVHERFPHLVERAKPFYEQLCGEAPILENQTIIAPPMEPTRKRKAEEEPVTPSEEREEVQQKKINPTTQPSAVEAGACQEKIVVGASEATLLQVAQATRQVINDGFAHAVKPPNYREAMRSLFHSLNK
jgi:hypothetical protein